MQPEKHAIRRNILNLFLVLSLLLIAETGCKVIIRTEEAQGSIHLSSIKPVKHNRYLWGLVKDSVYIIPTEKCSSNSLQRVEVRHTFGKVVLTFLTLGIYCPVDIAWICKTEAPPEPPPRQ